MKKFLITLILFFSVVSSACAVSVSAQSAILMEATTGKILFSKDIHTRRGMASTTKIMTALVVLESADLEEIVSVKQSCTGIEGSSMYLQPGEQLSVSDLLYGLLLQSGNDCAAVLADHVAGSSDRFVSLMNQKASELGLTETHFTNPSGLPHEDHYSTAYDMASLAAYAMQNQQFRSIVSTKTFQIGTHYLTNHNRLLSMCDGVDGIKTGFTKAAGRCLVSSAVRDGIRLIAVTLNAPNDWDDHQTLYDFGFSDIKQIYLHRKGDFAVSLPIIGGVSSKIPIMFDADFGTIVSEAESGDIEIIYYLPRFLYAPITKNAQVGSATLQVRGETVLTVPLIAKKSVAQHDPQGFISKFSYFIRKRFLG